MKNFLSDKSRTLFLSKHASRFFSLDVQEQTVFMAIWLCHIECMAPDFSVGEQGEHAVNTSYRGFECSLSWPNRSTYKAYSKGRGDLITLIDVLVKKGRNIASLRKFSSRRLIRT
jgi:hypothetical protein